MTEKEFEDYIKKNYEEFVKNINISPINHINGECIVELSFGGHSFKNKLYLPKGIPNKVYELRNKICSN